MSSHNTAGKQVAIFLLHNLLDNVSQVACWHLHEQESVLGLHNCILIQQQAPVCDV